MSSERIKGEVVFTCDTCEETLETDVSDFDEANAARRSAGWGARLGAEGWEHICADCPAWNPR